MKMFSCVEFKKKKIPKVVDPDVAIKKMFFFCKAVLKLNLEHLPFKQMKMENFKN